VDANAILIKWTYNGDSDLSGSLDADDYARIDAAYATAAAASYYSGDFDYSDKRNADDYFLIDRAFAGQGQVLAQIGAAPAAAAEVVESDEVVRVAKPARQQKHRGKQKHHARNRRHEPKWGLHRAAGLRG
jgi:hypothetical protein